MSLLRRFMHLELTAEHSMPSLEDIRYLIRIYGEWGEHAREDH